MSKLLFFGCFQWLKVTKMKANHNTSANHLNRAIRCFQWLKVTKMKANHNRITATSSNDLAVSNGSKLLK